MLLSAGSSVVPLGGIGALGDSLPSGPGQMYYPSDGIDLTNLHAAYAALYKAQPWVYTLVQKIALGTSRLPLKLYRRDTDGSRLDEHGTAYAELLAKPSPRWGGKALWLWTVATRELYGEAMWLKRRDDQDQVRQLFPLHPANLLVRPGPDGEQEYVYVGRMRATAMLPPFPARDVVHFKSYNPDNTTRGLSPCEPLRQTLLAEDATRRGQAAMWRNGARPSVVLTTDKAMSEPAIRRMSASWDAMHSGIDSWGKTAILEEGATPHVLQVNPNEMQYVESRRLNREECCAVWDIPPPAVHILDRATFSNITEQMRSLYRDSMSPRLGHYEDTIATQLTPDFDPTGATYAEFLLDEVLRGAYEARMPANAQAIQTGQATPNEVRRRENLPDMAGGDQLYINAALIPLVAAKDSPATGTEIAQAPQHVKALTQADGRLITGRLSRVTDLAEVDADRLLSGIDGDTTQVRGLLAAALARGTSVTALRRQIGGSADLDLAELIEPTKEPA